MNNNTHPTKATKIDEIVSEFGKKCFTVVEQGGWSIPYEGIIESKAIDWLRTTLQVYTATLEGEMKQRRQEYGPQYVDITGFGDFANIVCITNEDIDKIIEETYTTAKREALREVVEIVEDSCTWLNVNNHIPDSELPKGDEHWDMLRKIVKDSLSELNENVQKRITHLESELR